MTYKEYMARVDEKMAEMNEDKLRCWLRNYARQRPEKERESFLLCLTETEENEQDHRNMEKIKKWLQKVENEELTLTFSSYDSGYWDSGWTDEYEDNNGIGKFIEWAYEQAEKWTYEKKYQYAAYVYQKLNECTVTAEDEDGGDAIELWIEDLNREALAKVDLKKTAALTIYTLCQISAPQEKCAVIYPYFVRPMGNKLKIEDIFTAGPEPVKDTEDFMKRWVAFLEKSDDQRALDLLEDALVYEKGEKGLQDYALKKADIHPSLAKKEILRLFRAADHKAVLEAGPAAVFKMEPLWKIRGETAAIVRQAAAVLHDAEIEREMAYQACLSKPSVRNYLRWIMLDSHTPEQYSEVDCAVKREVYHKEAFSDFGKCDEKSGFILGRSEYIAIQFLNENYSYILECCKKQKQPLGWSGQPIETGVLLLLFALYQGNSLNKITKQLCRTVLGYDSEELDEDEIQKILFRWKASHQFPSDQAQMYIDYLEKTIDGRIKAIVSEKHRGSYFKAAFLAAALDEVLKSRGINKEIADRYHKIFPKHRAFREELNKLT